MMLTQVRLKELLHYDPETGEFQWIARSGKRADLVGTIAGSPSTQGYTLISVDYRKHRAHRLAFLYMTGTSPRHHVDHRNAIKNDNRWENLRPATKAQNSMAVGIRANNTSGVTGVYWSKAAHKWQAFIKKNRRVRYLGIFEDFHMAVLARRNAEAILFGEFAPSAVPC